MSQELIFSPLDQRYAKMLPASLSEAASLSAQVEVEICWLETLMDEGLVAKVSGADLRAAVAEITFEEIEKIEARTQHATRALVEALAERLQKAGFKAQAEWVHVGLTSFDTVDTAQRLKLKRYFDMDGKKLWQDLSAELKRLAHAHAGTPQVGRTHGQWAVPSFFGLVWGEALLRLQEIQKRLDTSLSQLKGQASGAVGGYHAAGLIFKNPLQAEEKFLKKLGLSFHRGSTQILPPEDILFVAQDCLAACSVVAKLAQDLRHLARSEIGEVSEGMAAGQVGSSTMPQKRNPWNLEHVCSLYKVLLSRLSLIEQDLLSEHQRDLTNSASGRFYFEYFMFAHLMPQRLLKILKTLQVDEAQMKKHLQNAGSSVLAEAFYIELTRQNVPQAHDRVREASRAAESRGGSLAEVLMEQKLLPSNFEIKEFEKRVLAGPEQKMKWILEHS